MANTLTAIAPQLYSAANIVAAEPTGFLEAVKTDFDDKGAALNDAVKVPYSGDASVSDYTPAMTTTAGDDATAATVSVTLTQNKQKSYHLTGEQQRSLENANVDKAWIADLSAEAMRAIRNGHESHIATAAKEGAAFAIGTAGTNPFTTNIDSLADVKGVMLDNGAPIADLQCVMNSAAYVALIKQGLVTEAQKYGGNSARATGVLGNFYNFTMRTSGQISAHTKGTGTGYLINNASNEAVGQTTLTLDTGSGTMIAGDVITHASDTTNQYVVNSALAAGDVVIGRPGLKIQADDDDAITIGDNYTPNCCFERAAVVSVSRNPIIPANANIKQMTVTDVKGQNYLLCEIVGDGMITWRFHRLYGAKVVNSQYVGILLG